MWAAACYCCLLQAVLVSLSAAISTVTSHHRIFEVDYQHDRFLKDGEPFRYVSGSLHYFRVPRPYWQDRLRKLRGAGLNAVCTYVEWSRHEPQPGAYDFSGVNDLEYFIHLAQQEDLLVILRPGPYICAEREFGGLPPWLLHENPDMALRSNDSSYTKYVHSWLSVLLPRIQPLLYGNGGPIIMLQVENEYGSYWACDHSYTFWLRDVFRSYVNDKAVLFTTDGSGSGYLKCGPIPGVLATVDFGPVKNVSKEFEPLRRIQKHGPLVNSEFYPGWLTHWGEEQSNVSTDDVISSTRQLLQLNASFNFYMFHGGTNFGFSSGANIRPFQPQITSYDYDAPISESGSLTEKYYAIKSVISEFMPVKDVPVQSPATTDYGTVKLEPKVSLFDSDIGIDYGKFQYPETFESLQQYSGFMLYETTLPQSYPGRGYLEANNTHDRAIVLIDKSPVGILSRDDESYSINLAGTGGQTLGLLVENQGHINYGPMSDLKGLIDNVTLQGDILTDWSQTGYPMDNVSLIHEMTSVEGGQLPAFYAGEFQLPQDMATPQDTFVDMTGWGKGVLYINGFNLGRYWPHKGPQMSLYLPGTLLRQNNSFVILELETEHPNRTVSLVAHPVVSASLSSLIIAEFNSWLADLL